MKEFARYHDREFENLGSPVRLKKLRSFNYLRHFGSPEFLRNSKRFGSSREFESPRESESARNLRGLSFFENLKSSGRTRVLAFVLILFLLLPLVTGCGAGDSGNVGKGGSTGFRERDKLGNGWEPEDSLDLQYANQFSVDYYAGGFKLLSFADGGRFLLIPEGKNTPEGIASDIQPIDQPVGNIYLAATAVMSLFDALNCLDAIGFSGTEIDGWYNENARKAMENGDILYAGKYSEPDYELILSRDCTLAIESTMVHHTPEVKAKLEDLGIPVMIDQSSLENHPLGRAEWIKLYGALLNQEALADRLFDEQVSYVEQVTNDENTGKTVAFFYISASGYAVARKSGDYVCKMIALAGGNYIFSDLGDPEKASSTVNLEMEEFYATARDADVIIYNGSIGGELRNLDDLIAKNELLRDFKAVQEGNVWCTTKNLYQDPTHLGQMIMEMHAVFTSGGEKSGDVAGLESGEELEFLYKLR